MVSQAPENDDEDDEEEEEDTSSDLSKYLFNPTYMMHHMLGMDPETANNIEPETNDYSRKYSSGYDDEDDRFLYWKN